MKITRGLSIVLLSALLAGCSAALLNTSAYDIFTSQDVNLVEKNYAAGDFLIQRGRNFVGKGDLIRAVALEENGETHKVTKIAKVIPEQVGVRLADLGYRVDLSEVISSGTNYMKPAVASGENPDYILSGSYIRRRIEMDVSLRIADARDGRVVAAFDYILPLNREIADMSEPEVEIYRTTPGAPPAQ